MRFTGGAIHQRCHSRGIVAEDREDFRSKAPRASRRLVSPRRHGNTEAASTSNVVSAKHDFIWGLW
jgi:hypothetical protein